MTELHHASVREGSPRDAVDINGLRLPPCPLPRPGDKVVWYQGGLRTEGELIGYTADCRPLVQSADLGEFQPETFDAVRLADPACPIGPNWCRLPETAKVCRPSPEELRSLGTLLSDPIPPGASAEALVEEIWNRGYEVFLHGLALRELIRGQRSPDLDIATTMPLNRLRNLVNSMYDQIEELQDFDREAGTIRIGRKEASPDRRVTLRAFSFRMPGSRDAVFGGSFAKDTAYRDFTCNCIYYDPINQVFIDPTGKGLDDAEELRVRSAQDDLRRSDLDLGLAGLRMLILVAQGWVASPDYARSVSPRIRGIDQLRMISILRTELFAQVPEDDRRDVLIKLQKAFIDLGEKELWDVRLSSMTEQLIA
jgi:hypothetical protein